MNDFNFERAYIFLKSCFVDIEFNIGEDDNNKLIGQIIKIRRLSNKILNLKNALNKYQDFIEHRINGLKNVYEIKYNNLEGNIKNDLNLKKFSYEQALNKMLLHNENVRLGRSYAERVAIANQSILKELNEYEQAKDSYNARKYSIDERLKSILEQIENYKNLLDRIKTLKMFIQDRFDQLMKCKEDINSIIKLLEIDFKIHSDLK